MSDIEESGASTPHGVSRRTVTKAMAWAVPAVAVAAAAPAFAASGKPPIIVAGAACKLPGNSCKTLPPKGYQVPATIQNPDPTKTIYIYSITISNNTCANLTGATAVPAPIFSIPPNQPLPLNVTFVANASNSADQSCSFDFEVTWGHAADGSDHDHAPIPVHVNIPSTPPDCVCPPA